jgi:predicted PurR-regulated permease PerM
MRVFPHHFRRGLATSLVFALLAFGLFEMIYLIINPLAGEIRSLSANWKTYEAQAQGWITNIRTWYETLPPNVREWIDHLEFGAPVGRMLEQIQHLGAKTLESGMLLVELILIPVLAFSFLTESRPLKREFAIVLPPDRLRDGLYVLKQTGIILQSYAVGQLILALIAGGVTWLLMTVMGMKYALAMAVVAAITRVIPVVGPLLGGVPIVILCALQGMDKAAVVLVGFTIMHLVESKVIMPRIIGYRINLHPAVVIIVLLIGAEFFGMWGMFLAAPVAAVVKCLFYYFVVRPRRKINPTPPPELPHKEPAIERPAVTGVRGHSGAH